jgi:hypothetical protein
MIPPLPIRFHAGLPKGHDLFADPIYKQVTNLVYQNEKLRSARDLILPQLMNGKIAV